MQGYKQYYEALSGSSTINISEKCPNKIYSRKKE